MTQSDLNRHTKSQVHLLRSQHLCVRCGEGFVTPRSLEDHQTQPCHRDDNDSPGKQDGRLDDLDDVDEGMMEDEDEQEATRRAEREEEEMRRERGSPEEQMGDVKSRVMGDTRALMAAAAAEMKRTDLMAPIGV